MTATADQVQAAGAALALGEQLAREHWQSAAQSPGRGWQVSLPSVPDSQGRLVKGEGYNLPSSTSALSSPAPRRLIPDYGLPAVGGSGYHSAQPGTLNGLDGAATFGSPSSAGGDGPEDFRQPRWVPLRSESSRSSISYISPSRGAQTGSKPSSTMESTPTSTPSSKSVRSGRIRKALRGLRRKS
jgi:hypothetical protein